MIEGLFDDEFSFEYTEVLGVKLKLKPQDAGQIDSQMHLTLWPAAAELCNQAISFLRPSISVLELGAGTGLVGLFASKLSGSVEITDGNAESIELIRDNIALNNSPSTCYQLQWGSSINKYDLILCSDVIYSSLAIRPLLETIHSGLAPTSICLLSNHRIRLSQLESQLTETCASLNIDYTILPTESQDIKTYKFTLKQFN